MRWTMHLTRNATAAFRRGPHDAANDARAAAATDDQADWDHSRPVPWDWSAADADARAVAA
jgi:hypothetical protein